MISSGFYRNDRPASGNRVSRTPSAASPASSRSSSTGTTPSDPETPLTTRQQRHENAIASGVTACQTALTRVLKQLEENNHNFANLTKRIDQIERKVDGLEQPREEDRPSSTSQGKRKRPKDSLMIQEEVHKLHSSKDDRNQYNGLQSVCSPHNQVVTSYITKQLKAKGYDEIKVGRAAKKFHEHIRRVAQGKVGDELKTRMRMTSRKGRKYNQRKSCLDPAKTQEINAFNALSKYHMSSDEEDLNDSSQWLSRPPTYRSDTLKKFLQKLDKVHSKRSSRDRKFSKKIKRTEGEAKEVELPASTPVWAISREWMESQERTNNEDNEVVQEEEEMDEMANDRYSQQESESEDEQSELDFSL